MVQISAVIITFNEEKNIERCLISLQGIADEIVVVDSYSQDKTKEICEKFENVKFIERDWKGYSNAKNFANDQAKNEWILSIDADEELDHQLQNEIQKLKQTISKDSIYLLNRLTNYCGKWIYHSSWYPDIKERIFEKNKIHWSGEFVHEELEIPSTFNKIILKGHLNHYSYYDKIDHLKRANKYSSLTAQKMHAKGKKSSVLKPYLSSIARFISMYFIKKGFLDGSAGFWIAYISAKSNIFKYKELRRLNKLR